jgi:hypothetical protein
MSQTRAELDRKITTLEARAHDLTPRAVAGRYLPERATDYAIGGVLTLVGARMAWGRYRTLVTSLQIDDVQQVDAALKATQVF